MNDQTILANSEIFKIAESYPVVTHADQEKLFTALVKEYKPKTFSDLREKVASLFNNKLDEPLNRWENKLTLDKSRLKDLFLNQS